MTTTPYGSFLGTGWAFPPAFTKGGEEVVLVQNEQDIFESLQILLGTSLGERVMREDYGCNLRDYLFEELDQRLLSNLRLAVMNAIRNHEGRIEAEAVEFDVDTDFQQSVIRIHLHFRVRATNARYNLVYPFYLTESVAATGSNAVLPDYSRNTDLLLPEAPKPTEKEDEKVHFESIRHVATVQNTENWTSAYTLLDHPLLNNKPNAIIFISRVWGYNPDAPNAGIDQNSEYEVAYVNNRWAITSRNPTELMDKPYAFNVLIAPNNTPNAFVHTVGESNRRPDLAWTYIDHPLSNNNPNAFLLVTPRKSVVSDRGIGISYVPESGQWILIHRFISGPHESHLFAVGAAFNVLVMPSANYGNIEAFDHLVSQDNIRHSGTALPIEKTNGTADKFLFTIAWLGGNRGGTATQGSFLLWYDHPKDIWDNWINGHWFIYQIGGSTPANMLFNVFKIKN